MLKDLRVLLLSQWSTSKWREIEVSVIANELLCFCFQRWELLLKYVLLSSEVVVKYDLLLQVVDHFIANFVSLLDTCRDSRMSCLEIIQCILLCS